MSGGNKSRSGLTVDACRLPLSFRMRRAPKKRSVLTASLTGYMDRAGTREGHLIIFDQGERKWEEKIFHGENLCGSIFPSCPITLKRQFGKVFLH